MPSKSKKKPAPKPPKKKLNVSAFVRENLLLPIPEVVSALAKHGLKVSPAYVSNVRTLARKKAQGPRRGRPPGHAPRLTGETLEGLLMRHNAEVLAFVRDALGMSEPR